MAHASAATHGPEIKTNDKIHPRLPVVLVLGSNEWGFKRERISESSWRSRVYWRYGSRVLNSIFEPVSVETRSGSESTATTRISSADRYEKELAEGVYLRNVFLCITNWPHICRVPFLRSKPIMMSIPSISPNLLNAKFQALNSTNSKYLLNPAFFANQPS